MGGARSGLIVFVSFSPLIEIAFSVNQRRSALSEGGKSGLGSNMRLSFRKVECNCTAEAQGYIAHLRQTAVPVESHVVAHARNR